MIVVSGMARGVDTAAHRGALEAGGRTVGVLGCGIDVIYPAENRRLFEAMAEAGVKTLVFSSSATVYGVPHALPMREDFPLSAANPYGRSKWVVEEILRDLAVKETNGGFVPDYIHDDIIPDIRRTRRNTRTTKYERILVMHKRD